MKLIYFVILCTTLSCEMISPARPVALQDTSIVMATAKDSMKIEQKDTLVTKHIEQSAVKAGNEINTGATTPSQLLSFAKTLIGVPYLYASSNPAKGFDCSGFITYVFNHFNIDVPRSSVDFTNVGTEVPLANAKPGDLVLFTGTDSTIRIVGHMGIVTENNNSGVAFIHATSGKQYGVTITPLNDYYMGRFVKIIRVFENNKA